jgi:hypothetical protein
MKMTKKLEAITYILEMSTEGAQFLQDLCTQVGGCPVKSRRRIADRLRHALQDAGVDTGPMETADMVNNAQGIHFNDLED